MVTLYFLIGILIAAVAHTREPTNGELEEIKRFARERGVGLDFSRGSYGYLLVFRLITLASVVFWLPIVAWKIFRKLQKKGVTT